MILTNIREMIAEVSHEALVFDNPSFDKSILGLSTDGRVIYDMDKMVEEIMSDDKITEEEAIDFISYNTLRSMDYMTAEYKPVILDANAVSLEIKLRD